MILWRIFVTDPPHGCPLRGDDVHQILNPKMYCLKKQYRLLIILFYEFTRLMALRGTAGQEVFLNFIVTDPPRGRPVGGGGVHHKGIQR
jgi:hypothetical protein